MLSARERRLLGGLARRRNREREGLFLAEGPRVVEDLLASSLEPTLVVVASTFADTPDGAALLASLGESASVRVVAARTMRAVARTETPQGVLAVARIPEFPLASLPDDDRGVALVLDGVQDPGNAGALVRTAEALGAGGVVALEGTVDLWSPKVVRAAAGALFRLPVVRADTGALLAWAREAGATVFAADAGGEDVRTVGPGGTGLSLLVLGNEGAGVGAEIRAAAAERLAVPQHPGAESLNVAAAGAILLWELLGRRPG
ncbi:MAG TPA: RNA methyltransferase [Longimicrobiales bacterium]|nr:RNA methyltransferase [Longimicrobiales bacterium]